MQNRLHQRSSTNVWIYTNLEDVSMHIIISERKHTNRMYTYLFERWGPSITSKKFACLRKGTQSGGISRASHNLKKLIYPRKGTQTFGGIRIYLSSRCQALPETVWVSCGWFAGAARCNIEELKGIIPTDPLKRETFSLPIHPLAYLSLIHI